MSEEVGLRRHIRLLVREIHDHDEFRECIDKEADFLRPVF
jgi:hypothetical protein